MSEIKTTDSVGEDILIELKRARELLGIYQGLPAQSGFFGVAMIKQAIDRAERALAEGDIIAILQSYEELKTLE